MFTVYMSVATNLDEFSEATNLDEIVVVGLSTPHRRQPMRRRVVGCLIFGVDWRSMCTMDHGAHDIVFVKHVGILCSYRQFITPRYFIGIQFQDFFQHNIFQQKHRHPLSTPTPPHLHYTYIV